MTTNLAKRFTQPIYLVKQDMGASFIYSSSRELINYAGNNYLGSLGLAVENINNLAVTWSIDNSDRAVTALALNNAVGGNAVSVYLHYEGETILRFEGVLDEWYTQGQRVVFVATSAGARAQKFPNERAELGVFNHLPPAGTSITWGRQTIHLEAEDI